MIWFILAIVVLLAGGACLGFFLRSGTSPEPIRKVAQAVFASAAGAAISAFVIAYVFLRLVAGVSAASVGVLIASIVVVLGAIIATWQLADVAEPTPLRAALRKIGTAMSGSALGNIALVILIIVLFGTQKDPVPVSPQPPKTEN